MVCNSRETPSTVAANGEPRDEPSLRQYLAALIALSKELHCVITVENVV